MSRDEHVKQAEALIEALPYIQRFRGHLFVIKYGGSAMEDEDMVERLLRDVVFLEAVGINPVLIHGGGKAISDKMRQEGIKPRFVNGLRVTDEKSIRIVEETLDDVINPKIVASIIRFGGQAVGFSGRRVFKARRLPVQTDELKREMVDLGFVGEVTGLGLTQVQKVIAREAVPVISPIAEGEGGEPLNVNADVAAGAIAGALKASKLIYLSDVPGLMRDPAEKDSLIPSVNREKIAMLMEEKIIDGGMIPKTESALRALEAGVSKAHFIDGRIPHALLLEIFTNAGIGTELVP
jgi:acetylglutamate kinase